MKRDPVRNIADFLRVERRIRRMCRQGVEAGTYKPKWRPSQTRLEIVAMLEARRKKLLEIAANLANDKGQICFAELPGATGLTRGQIDADVAWLRKQGQWPWFSSRRTRRFKMFTE